MGSPSPQPCLRAEENCTNHSLHFLSLSLSLFLLGSAGMEISLSFFFFLDQSYYDYDYAERPAGEREMLQLELKIASSVLPHTHLSACDVFSTRTLSAWLHERNCHFVSIMKPFPGEFHCFSNRIFVKGLLFCLKRGNKNELLRAHSTKQLGRERLSPFLIREAL